MKRRALPIVVAALGFAALSLMSAPLIVQGQSLTGTFDVLDTVPPSAVTDLRISGYTETAVTLVWTAPGDDDLPVGSASVYDLRYATFSITAGNWMLATPVPDEPAPRACGSTETLTVTGLNPGVGYYFALRAADEVPNWSAISNVVERAASPSGGGGGGGGGGMPIPAVTPAVRPVPMPTSNPPAPEPTPAPVPFPTPPVTEPPSEPSPTPTPQVEPSPEPVGTPLELDLRSPEPGKKAIYPSAGGEDRTWLWVVIGPTVGFLAAVFTFWAIGHGRGGS